MDSFILLTHDPIIHAVVAIFGLALGTMVARRVLRSRKVHQPTASSDKARAPLNEWYGVYDNCGQSLFSAGQEIGHTTRPYTPEQRAFC